MHGEHIQQQPRSRTYLGAVIAAFVVLIVSLALIFTFNPARALFTHQLAATSVEKPVKKALSKKSEVPATHVPHHGKTANCSATDCVSLLVNGDLLFHAGLWNQYSRNPSATDGSAFDFTDLFASLKPYIDASDIAVCEFETPTAHRGGPYSAYPIFAIPPEVVDAAAKVGYQGCTHATNHSWDQHADGIALLRQEMQDHGLQQVGSYTSQDQIKPMILHSADGGPSIAVITGTVSVNGLVPDEDWMIDRLRGREDPHHAADVQRIVDQAKMAREEGADLVVFAMHSVQEYIDYADSWQVDSAHELADLGIFDLIYGAGSHSVQPIENYNNTWIIYGTGNTVTESAPPERVSNNQGMTARITFAGYQGDRASWHVQSIDWVGSANMRAGRYHWCSLGEDQPDGPCWSAQQDTAVRNRLQSVIYSKGADPHVVRPWKLNS